MKAVTKMRYEFNNRLSAVDKKLLDQESPLNLCEKSFYDSDFMDRIQHPKYVLYCTRHHYAKLQLFTIKENNINYWLVPMLPQMKLSHKLQN